MDSLKPQRKSKKSYVGYSTYTKSLLTSIEPDFRMDANAKSITDYLIHDILSHYGSTADKMNAINNTQTFKVESVMSLNDMLFPSISKEMNRSIEHQMKDYFQHVEEVRAKKSRLAKQRMGK